MFFISSKLSKKFSNKNRVGLKFWDPGCSNNQKSFSSTFNLKDAFAIAIRQRQDLCNRYKIKCITFIQPIPGYLNIHKHKSYGLKEAKVKINLLIKDVNNLNFNIEGITAALENYNSHVYIDGVHYSSAASNVIAKKILKKNK